MKHDIEDLYSTMTAQGFVFNTALDASFIEFHKDYGSTREVCRVTLQFEKPSILHPRPFLQHAVVTRQQLISLLDPELPDAPLLVREELQEIKRLCRSWLSVQEQAAVRKSCSRCGLSIVEFIDLGAGVYCVPCLDQIEKVTP